MIRKFLTGIMLCLSMIPLTAQADRAQDHQALRVLLQAVTQDLNERKLDRLKTHLAPSFEVIFLDQTLRQKPEDLDAAFKQYFEGPNAVLKSIRFDPKADSLTRFLSENVGVCHGSSLDTYTFTDGATIPMETRWTATVVKEGGEWKLASLHAGVSLMQNPVLEGLKRRLTWIGLGAGLAGLFLGFLLGRWKR
jgi:hypothetical protein